jgi:hypothetical protein
MIRKLFLSLVIALPGFAQADLGDSRSTVRHYPAGWKVTHLYNEQGIAVLANYQKDGWFTTAELTEILKRNRMHPEVWNYVSHSDGSLWNEDPAIGSGTIIGEFLLFRPYDLGIKDITVGIQEGWKLAPRQFIEERLQVGHHLDPEAEDRLRFGQSYLQSPRAANEGDCGYRPHPTGAQKTGWLIVAQQHLMTTAVPAVSAPGLQG